MNNKLRNEEYNTARIEQLENVIEHYQTELRKLRPEDWRRTTIKSRLDEGILEWEERAGRKYEVKR